MSVDNQQRNGPRWKNLGLYRAAYSMAMPWLHRATRWYRILLARVFHGTRRFATRTDDAFRWDTDLALKKMRGVVVIFFYPLILQFIRRRKRTLLSTVNIEVLPANVGSESANLGNLLLKVSRLLAPSGFNLNVLEGVVRREYNAVTDVNSPVVKTLRSLDDLYFTRYAYCRLNTQDYVDLFDGCRSHLSEMIGHIRVRAGLESSNIASIKNFCEGKVISKLAYLAERNLWLRQLPRTSKCLVYAADDYSAELARSVFMDERFVIALVFDDEKQPPEQERPVSPYSVFTDRFRASGRPKGAAPASEHIYFLLATSIPQYLQNVPLMVAAIEAKFNKPVKVISSVDLTNSARVKLPADLYQVFRAWEDQGRLELLRRPRSGGLVLTDGNLAMLKAIHVDFWRDRPTFSAFSPLLGGEAVEFERLVSWQCLLDLAPALLGYPDLRSAYEDQVARDSVTRVFSVPGRIADHNLFVDVVNKRGGGTLAIEGAAVASGGNVLEHLSRGIAIVDSFQASIFEKSHGLDPSRLHLIGSAEFERFLKSYSNVLAPAGYSEGLLFLAQYLYAREFWYPFFVLVAQWQELTRKAGRDPVPLWVKLHPRQGDVERENYAEALRDLAIVGSVLPAEISLEGALKIARVTATVSSIAVFQGLMVGRPFVTVSDAVSSFDPARSGYGERVETVGDLQSAWEGATEGGVGNPANRYVADNPWIRDPRDYFQRLADSIERTPVSTALQEGHVA
ncbi:MAG: hypothetical protein KF723_01980 [Rhizobiaceae bacterium]|nr:hypothetical protein [Rhizobiaceae bacterium]